MFARGNPPSPWNVKLRMTTSATANMPLLSAIHYVVGAAPRPIAGQRGHVHDDDTQYRRLFEL